MTPVRPTALTPITLDDDARAVVPAAEMRRVHREVRTPHKHGLVIAAPPGSRIDCPSVFRHGDAWYMLYVEFDGARGGYETRMARSADLVTWSTLGTILPFRPGAWDSAQAAGYVALQDVEWGGSGGLLAHDGRYWLTYLGGSTRGYEEGTLSIGVAHSTDPTVAAPWTRLPAPALAPDDGDARPWESAKLYKSNVIRDDARTLGEPYVMFYNASDSRTANAGAEQIGVATSRDMVTWTRHPRSPVITPPGTYAKRVVGDPQVARIGSTWVMFMWCRFAGESGTDVWNTFACSTDLIHWTAWSGEPLVTSSEPFDAMQAHSRGC